jgi:hypothetical protein
VVFGHAVQPVQASLQAGLEKGAICWLLLVNWLFKNQFSFIVSHISQKVAASLPNIHN